jgi:hypothetical protein
MDKSYTLLIDSLIPDNIKEDYPKYVEFVKQYLGALETETGPLTVVNNLAKVVDIYEVPDDIIANAVNQYLNSFPSKYLESLNVREFITNAKTFYSNKGNENSFRFIYNLLGGTVNFYYPANDIFISNISTLSGHHKIHDNFYYAYYVYEVQTDVDVQTYYDLFKRTVHPAGMKMFALKIMIFNEGEVIFVGIEDLKYNYSIEYEKQNLDVFSSGSNVYFVESDPILTNYLRDYSYYSEEIQEFYTYSLEDFYRFNLEDFYEESDKYNESLNIQRKVSLSEHYYYYPNNVNYPSNVIYPTNP